MAWDLTSASISKLALNRLVRTRMPGGWEGPRGNPGPYPDPLLHVRAQRGQLP